MVSAADLARAVRLLAVRSRREATGLFAGNYASAFRGSGLEFEESRPYSPGDDVSVLDWSATARSGELYVKRFREERNQTLLFALDASASMLFGTAGRTRAETAAHALALLVAAASRAGDRTGLVVSGGSGTAVPVGRGSAHGLRVIRAAVDAAARPDGAARLSAGLRALRGLGRRRSAVFVLSDFRDENRLALRGELAELGRRHDLVALPIVDPADEALPHAGTLRVADPERPGRTLVLRTGSPRVRRRYSAATRAWRRGLERDLRRSGAEVLWLRNDRSPLYALGRFFSERAARRAAA
ncbi:MAG: DUF58 domain-containing protein [Myxococcota bacterium]|nr:DUF58 domain-containing protein [Myxococcota bacterium]